MQVVKISFALTLSLILCSFSFKKSDYKTIHYQQFISKFGAPVTGAAILDVRNNVPLPVSEAEFQAMNMSRPSVKKMVQERMLMGDFDLYISEISRKGKGGTRPNTYEAECLLKQTKHLDVVIYSEYQDARQFAKTYYLAAFTKTGVIVAKERIGMSNELVYTEAKMSDALVLKANAILNGQKLPLETNKLKLKHKGGVESVENSHPYLDAMTKNMNIQGAKNYRLRVE